MRPWHVNKTKDTARPQGWRKHVTDVAMAMITGRTDRQTDRQTDGQTDRQTDRVRRNMRPPPREEGRITSCAHGDTICLRRCKLTISSHLFARWHLFRHVGYLGHQQQVELWPVDLESGVPVTCDVGYVCANFSLPRPLCSRVRPDVRDRQTSDKHRL